MIRKTDKYFKRYARAWERGNIRADEVLEVVRRETWWILWLPVYSRDSVVTKQI